MNASMLLPFAAFSIPDDFIGFTFLLTTLAMLAASAFFLLERTQVPARWRISVLVAGLVTLIAGTNYVFMSIVWTSTHIRPIEIRYLDWFLTVPLICLQFYLLLEAAGAKPGWGMLVRLVVSSIWMLAFGFVGQIVDPGQTMLWGGVSTLGYAAILLELSFGEANRLSIVDENPQIKQTYDLLSRFLFIGWAIYPIGYMTSPGNLLARLYPVIPFPVLYNLGDAVNKIGFGLVIWRLAKSSVPDVVTESGGPSAPRTPESSLAAISAREPANTRGTGGRAPE